jgi:hypothetical protein
MDSALTFLEGVAFAFIILRFNLGLALARTLGARSFLGSWSPLLGGLVSSRGRRLGPGGNSGNLLLTQLLEMLPT